MPEEMDALLAGLKEHLVFKDDDGRVVIQVALLATVYFDDPYKREVREALVSCCEDYFQLCGEHLRWAVNPDTEFMERFGEGKGSNPRAWVPERHEDEDFALICHGGDQHPEANAFSIQAFGAERRQYSHLGNLRVSFPVLWFSEHPGSLTDVLLNMCRKLKPVSGYGGIGLIESPSTSVRHWHESTVYQLAQRLPGLEVDRPISHAIWQRQGNGIKGVNWLTVVGDRLSAKLGGLDAMQAEVSTLDSRFLVQRFEGGVMIQAGAHPDLGDAAHNIWPELYVKLAKYLQPIRITQHRAFHQAAFSPTFDKESSEAWLRRFDDR